jgi:NADP-dependent 3-hydroxy acid dehydrogenase YdfG
LVTGASRGIGAAVARALSAAGARVVATGRDRVRIDQVAAELAHGAAPFIADLTVPGAALGIARHAIATLGAAPDIVVHAAGSFPMAALGDATDASLEEALALNAAAPLRLTRELLGPMRERGSGHFVTIGSVADRSIFPSNAVYAASKHAARALHETLRAETRGSGLRTTLISPSATDTPIWDPYEPDASPHLPSRAEMLRPDDVADAVLWAVTRPQHVNIEELRISRS